MKTCRTCKHWKKSDWQQMRATEDRDVAYCAKIRCEDADPETFSRQNDLVLMDYAVCSLLTKPDFGCILHEEKG